MASYPITSWQREEEILEREFLFCFVFFPLGLQNHCIFADGGHLVMVAMKLKDTCSLKGKI